MKVHEMRAYIMACVGVNDNLPGGFSTMDVLRDTSTGALYYPFVSINHDTEVVVIDKDRRKIVISGLPRSWEILSEEKIHDLAVRGMHINLPIVKHCLNLYKINPSNASQFLSQNTGVSYSWAYEFLRLQVQYEEIEKKRQTAQRNIALFAEEERRQEQQRKDIEAQLGKMLS